ncbi:MAG: VWA domain-containing protein [Gemmatimonadetes bacterium]|nr:VWA domain-containing protein [Gemmatimonadota bacterium]
MPYSAEISRSNPTCFIFLIDQSGSMSESFGTESAARKADFVADVVNRTLHDLVIRCTRTEEIRSYYEVSVIGYGSSVGSMLSGGLSGRNHVPISEVADSPARLETRSKKVPDGAGGLVEQTVRFPIWVDPTSNGGTPMCQAFSLAQRLLAEWTATHPHSFPPTVLHLTDGESTDGDPTEHARQILGTGTSDGATLLFNCHVSSKHAMKVAYPNDESRLPDEYARSLFRCSSRLPESFRQAAVSMGVAVEEGAYGFVFNGDPVSVAQFFEIGTRPANLR